MTRVLVVDDSPVIAEYVAALLVGQAEVRVVTTCARRLLDPESFLWDGVDILACDLRMPEVDGLDILNVARIYHPGILRRAVTGIADEDLLVEAETVAKLISKATSPALLAAAILS